MSDQVPSAQVLSLKVPRVDVRFTVSVEHVPLTVWLAIAVVKSAPPLGAVTVIVGAVVSKVIVIVSFVGFPRESSPETVNTFAPSAMV